MLRKAAIFTALVLAFTIPWETAFTFDALGTLTRLIGIIAAGIWAASILYTGRFRKLHPYHFAVLAFMLLNLAGIFWTVSLDNTITRIKTYLQLFILIWLFWDIFDTAEALRMAMQVFIFGAYVTMASQLYNFASGQIISTYEQGRFSGAGQNANEFSLILSLTLPLAWYLAMSGKSGGKAYFLKIVNIVFIPLAVLATILTGSRTSLVTDIPGLMYIAYTMNKVKPVYRIIVLGIVFTAFGFAIPYIPQATIERLSTFGVSIAESDLGGRGKLWAASFQIFLLHPLLGVGPNALITSSLLGTHGHNTFLSIMAETGLMGLLLFLIILSIVIFEALKQPKHFAILWGTVLFVWFIGAFTLTWEYTKPTWFFLSLVILSAGIYKHTHEPVNNPGHSINTGLPTRS